MALMHTPICDFGWKAPAFSLVGLGGHTVTLEDVRGPAGTLLIFMCNHCPYVLAIADRLANDVRALQALGIGVAAIMSNDYRAYPADAPDKMKAFHTEHGFTFDYLLDEDQSVARAFGAVCTPDFFGFDSNLGLQYRGRIDNSPMHAANATARELLSAMTSVAKTGKGPSEQRPSMGCSIKWRGM